MAYQTAVGCSTALYIGKQSAKGTPQETGTSLFRTEVIDFPSPEPVIGWFTDPSLHAGVSDRAVYPGGISWKGTFKIRANYEGSVTMLLVAGVLGTYAAGPPITAVEAADAGYFTLFYNRGGMEPTPKFEQLSDVRLTGFTFSCEASTGVSAMGTFEFEYVASTYVNDHATISDLVPAPAVNPIIFTQAVTTTWCSGAVVAASPMLIRPKSVKIAYKVPYDPDNFHMGTLTPDAPVRTAMNSCEWEFTEVLQGIGNVNAAKVGAVCAGPLFVNFLTTTTKQLSFTSTGARCTKYSCTNPYGNMIETIGWKSYYHATDTGCLKVSATIAEP